MAEHTTNPAYDLGIDLQLQIYMLAAVFGAIVILLIFIIAALCGKVEKLKRESRKQQREWTNYDNYAFNCPTIQQGEELSRRGFVMHTNDSLKGQRPIRLVNQGNNIFGTGDPTKKASHARRSPSRDNGDGTRDASSDFSTVMNSETVIITTRDQHGNGTVSPSRNAENAVVPTSS